MKLTINGVEYVTGKLDAFKQFHITRRLTPVMLALAGAADTVAALLTGQGIPDVTSLQPMTEVIAGMSDADAEYVLHACMAVCQRSAGQGWQNVFAPGGGMLFDDIDMMVMLQLAIAVMRENLGNFFAALPAAPAASA
jgi:hypothetical protein